MPTYIYKGCIVKENRDGLLLQILQKTVPVLGCSGLIFACRVALRLLVGVCCWMLMLLVAYAVGCSCLYGRLFYFRNLATMSLAARSGAPGAPNCCAISSYPLSISWRLLPPGSRGRRALLTLLTVMPSATSCGTTSRLQTKLTKEMYCTFRR